MSRTPVNLYLEDLGSGVRRTEPADGASVDGGLVDGVVAGSIAERAGLRPGVRVIEANGHVLRDVIDFQFYTAEPRVQLRVQEPEGELRDYTIEKWPDDDIGLEFASATWDGVRICTNTCFFCFLKGNPKGMRRTLYVKDDDYRLSFLHGNFVTLTNLLPADWARLREQRLSPLNVSVHATDLDLRRRMLGYPEAPDILQQLKMLGRMRIQAHAQIVLCPGVNDGAALDKTIADLGALYPTVQTISIVPVGATEQFDERMQRVHRAVDETRACSPAYARALIRQVRHWQQRLRAEHGESIVHPADEYYLTAGARIPSAAIYDDFPQFENGIGMTRLLLDDWRQTRRKLRIQSASQPAALLGHERGWRDGTSGSGGQQGNGGADTAGDARASANEYGSPRLTVACGTLIAPLLSQIFAEFDGLTGCRSRVVPVTNQRLGPRINVSGLLSAGDFLATLRGEELGDVVILPRTSLDYFGRKFLDDGTPQQIERELGVPVRFASSMSDVAELLQAMHAGAVTPDVGRAESEHGRLWASR